MMKAAAPITGGINCPPVEPTDFDGARRASGEKPERDISGMVTMPTAITLLTAAAGDHAEQRRADHRDLGGAAAEAAHRRHRKIGEDKRRRRCGQHLAHQRERDDDQHRDLRIGRSCR